jgi:hypothetical protein
MAVSSHCKKAAEIEQLLDQPSQSGQWSDVRKGQLLLWLLALGGLVVAIPRVVSHDRQQTARTEEREAKTSSALSELTAKSTKSSDRIHRVSTHDPTAIAAALGSADTEEAATALDVLLPDLIKCDIAAAAKLAAGLDPWAKREQALLRVADTWAETDAMAAAAWCRGLKDAEERLHCLSAICAKLATTDPAKAITLTESLEAKQRQSLQASLTAAWIARDPAAAVAWIEARDDSDFRDLCWSTSLAEFARKDPDRAATLAADKIASGSLQEEAVISVLHQWVLQDRKAAAAWVELFPEGSLRERAMGELSGSH